MQVTHIVLFSGIIGLLSCSGGNSASTIPLSDTVFIDSIGITREEPIEDSFQLPSLVYQQSDSLRVEELLAKSYDRPDTMNRMEYFGRQFLGIPYVSHTLETDPNKEELVVNLSEMDCTTYVETCAALSIADMRGEQTFNGFCKALTQLRYKQGECNGYASRLHYFYTWVLDNEQMGFVTRIQHKDAPFTHTKKLDLNYMTTHPKRYRQLHKHPEWLNDIQALENSVKNMEIRYIPKALLNSTPDQLPEVQNGDIIAIITKKKGLDTSHLGIAIWENEKLHLMNASSIYHKVVLDKNTFHQYMHKRKMNLGAGIVRLNTLD